MRVRRWLAGVLRRRHLRPERPGLSPPPPRPPEPASVEAAVLDAVNAARESRERLRFDFRGRDGSETVRDVEPHRVVRSGRHWYLLGYDLGRADWRTFRLDRVTPSGPTGPKFEPRPIPTGKDAPYLSTVPDAAGAKVWTRPPDPAAIRAVASWSRAMLRPGAAVVIDTETTGLPGAICEIAVVDAATGATLLDTLVDPRTPMTASAYRIHGISDADVARSPAWPDVLPRFLAVTAGRQVLAYNVDFDAGVIRADTERYGLDLGDLAGDERWGCIMVRRAETLPASAGLALGAGHRALGDSLAALDVLHTMGGAAASAPMRPGPTDELSSTRP